MEDGVGRGCVYVGEERSIVSYRMKNDKTTQEKTSKQANKQDVSRVLSCRIGKEDERVSMIVNG